MKKNLTWIVIFVVLIFGLTIFTGCAEKKSVVTNNAAQEQVVGRKPDRPSPIGIPAFDFFQAKAGGDILIYD